MESLRIRPRTPDDDPQIVEIFHATSPYLPVPEVERFRFNMSMQPENAAYERHVAELDGVVVGTVRWNRLVFIAHQHTWWTEVEVNPEHWGRGIGSALYEFLLEHMIRLEATRLKCRVREDLARARSFAEKRGFIATGHGERLSRLNVRAAHLDGCRAAASRMPAEGVRITTLAELGEADERLLRAVHRLDDESSRDIPGSENWQPTPFEHWRRYLDAPGVSPHAFWLAMAGDRPVGMAVLDRQGERSAFNSYTGVDPHYRGKGIARALKLCTVEWARENGINYIFTGNDVKNKPMLSINDEMGYKPLPVELEMVKEL